MANGEWSLLIHDMEFDPQCFAAFRSVCEMFQLLWSDQARGKRQ